MTDREELANIIRAPRMHTNTSGDKRRAIADAILAAGYRKPRTITTVEEAAALPEGTVIRTIEQGYVFELAETIRNKAYGYSFGEEPGSFIDDSYLPAIVLYIPEEQS